MKQNWRVFMNIYNKLLNNLEQLKLLKIKEYLDNYINLINDKKMDIVQALFELTEEERELFEKGNRDVAIQISWQFEGCAVLLWTLGLLDYPSYPDTLVNPDEITSIISSCNNYSEFIRKCEFRSVEEILDLADLTYRYNWYCVDAQIEGEEPKINSEIVVERYRALKWLLTDEKWDKVDINT